ncbi:hypothetical protein BH10ACI3_BH10ACI3_00010 [soil metagenome]
MKYSAVKTVEPDYLRITADGEYYFEDLPAFIGYIKAEASAAKRSHVLIDCLALAGDMTEGERFEGGRLIADVFGPGLRAALLLPPHFITKLGELAAANRGAKLLVTSSEVEALKWLRKV